MMFASTQNIFNKWSSQQNFISEPNIKNLLSIAKSQVRGFTLIEAIKFIKESIDNQKKCYICDTKTSYVHGRIINHEVHWHCIGTC